MHMSQDKALVQSAEEHRGDEVTRLVNWQEMTSLSDYQADSDNDDNGIEQPIPIIPIIPILVFRVSATWYIEGDYNSGRLGCQWKHGPMAVTVCHIMRAIHDKRSVSGAKYDHSHERQQRQCSYPKYSPTVACFADWRCGNRKGVEKSHAVTLLPNQGNRRPGNYWRPTIFPTIGNPPYQLLTTLDSDLPPNTLGWPTRVYKSHQHVTEAIGQQFNS